MIHGQKKLNSTKEEFIKTIDLLFLKLELAYHYQFYKVFGTDERLNEGKKITKCNLLKTWVVRQFKNEYNPTHWHGGHISGAGFLKVPKSLGESTQQKKSKKYRGGSLQLIHGARMFTCPSTLNITPEVGDFYLFPNYLMHTVFPFKDTEEERRSISFNASIDEEIYNVYGK